MTSPAGQSEPVKDHTQAQYDIARSQSEPVEDLAFTIKKYLFSLSIAIFFFGCTNEKKRTHRHSNKRLISIVVDESFQKLFENQIYTFESIYPNAKIHAKFLL